MPEYNLESAKKFAETARHVFEDENESFEAVQVSVYLSLLACEISLKAILEKAGMNVPDIIKIQHNLATLFSKVTRCEIVKRTGSKERWISAQEIRSKVVESDGTESTVGKILGGKALGASRYPGEIRYGTGFRSFPPDALIKTAEAVISFAEVHWEEFRYREQKK